MKIEEKITEVQKKLLVQDEIFDRLLDKSITKEQLLEEIDKPTEKSQNGILKMAPIGVKKDIQNHREEYDSDDLTVLGNELYDNARDANATFFEVTTDVTAKILTINFYDNGKGVKDLREYLKLGGNSKNRISDSIGLAGQGLKLMMPFITIYGITETKLEDGTVKAQLSFFCHAKDSIVYLDLKPSGKVTSEYGTYVETKILKEALDYMPLDINDNLHSIYMDKYRTHLLKNPGEVRINGDIVVAEPFQAYGKTYNWKNHEGFLMIAEEELDKSDRGIVLNIYGKDVKVLTEKDFGIELPNELNKKIIGYIKADELKKIVKPNKEDINKSERGLRSIWQNFRKKIKQQIVEFLKDNGYLENKTLKGKDELTAMLNRDLQYLFKHNSQAHKMFKELLNKKKKGVTPKTTSGSRSKNAQVEDRKGSGKISGRVIFDKESKDKGFVQTTNIDDFFKDEDNGGPSALGKNEKCTIKVYKKISGQKELIRLLPDKKVVGPDFTIDNIPLNTQIVLKAYTTYGVPKHTNEPLGRPKGFIRLNTTKTEEKVIIPIQIQENLSYKAEERNEEVDFAFIERKEDPNGILKDTIIINSAHPLYKMYEKDDRAKYIHTLMSIVYALCSTIEDEDKRKRMFKKFLNVIRRR